jgi:hypothetical protein
VRFALFCVRLGPAGFYAGNRMNEHSSAARDLTFVLVGVTGKTEYIWKALDTLHRLSNSQYYLTKIILLLKIEY